MIAREAGGGRIDVSVAVAPGTPEWPGDTPYACGWTSTIEGGASVNLSTITSSPHVGTHADAPIHVRHGAGGVETLPLDAFDGPAYVLGVEGAVRDISLAELEARLPGPVSRLLLRTGRSVASGVFPEDWPVLDAVCAAALVARGLVLLGTDAPSVDRRTSTALATHHALFDGGACNLESLDLRGIADGWYDLTAYPVRLVGLDAAPVRAVLRPRQA